LARERTARHPLRTYLWLPAARAITLWFTPRIELLPFSGTVFPLAQAWEDDPVDQSVTVGLFLLNIAYVALALWGAVRLWRRARPARAAITLLLVFILLRTAFLTTLETPEPRYVLVCFPALVALAAHVFATSSELERQPSSGSG
jgi:peptidoglycan/LPS O-acetylase OafA/YrhL